ncbi:MAG TPA: L-aspartate oxidase, partial [Candidatus Ratteibacteria bacterium]|nr:L-aspartate oxidase [Candidatus Ratteibacteria bacterium]
KYAFLKEFYDKDGFEAQNMLIVSKLIAHSSLKREESRGTHFRFDFPYTDDKHWKKHILIKK